MRNPVAARHASQTPASSPPDRARYETRLGSSENQPAGLRTGLPRRRRHARARAAHHRSARAGSTLLRCNERPRLQRRAPFCSGSWRTGQMVAAGSAGRLLIENPLMARWSSSQIDMAHEMTGTDRASDDLGRRGAPEAAACRPPPSGSVRNSSSRHGLPTGAWSLPSPATLRSRANCMDAGSGSRSTPDPRSVDTRRVR